ncbi:MAG: Ig-like domain-containing protein [Myxococcota bacterium]|nr:Ig-like domain-containing protein [Myxococcota bacterium]
MKRWMWLAFALSACGEEPPDLNGDGQADAPGSVTQIAPVHPVASVSGYVYDVATGQAIEGASVSLFASSEHSETTGVDGYVNFSRIAAGGTALFAVAAEGYLSANGTVGIPSQSGDFPSANNHATMGRIGLMRAAPLTTKMFGSDLQGKGGVLMSFTAPYSFVVNGSYRGELALQATSEDDGTLRFEGAPNLAALGAVIAARGGSASFHAHADDSGAGVTLTRSFADIATQGRLPLFVRHADQLLHTMESGNSLRRVHSNVHDLVQRRQSVTPMNVATPMRILFDRAVDPGTLQTKLFNETGEAEVELAAEFSAGGRMISLTPALGSLSPSTEYNLYISATALNGAETWAGTANILTAGDATAPFGDEDYAVEWDDRNQDGEINGGDDLFLSADLPIGLRRSNGTSGLSSALAQFAFVAELDLENSVFGELDYTVNEVPSFPSATFVEPNPGMGIGFSGYTTKIRLRLPGAASFNPNMGISVRIKLMFDNPELVNTSNQVRMPDGTALTNYTIRLALP